MKFPFPLVSKTFADSVASSIVGVQPMQAPSGTVFHMNYGCVLQEFQRFLFNRKYIKTNFTKWKNCYGEPSTMATVELFNGIRLSVELERGYIKSFKYREKEHCNFPTLEEISKQLETLLKLDQI